MGDPTSGASTSASKRTKLIREMKFHLHDSESRKSSESFRKIKEAIVNRINLVEFDNQIEIWERKMQGTKFLFEKPMLVINYIDDVDDKEMPDFESVVKNDPLTTISRVERLMHIGGANENILDYLSRFRSGRDIMMQLFVSRLIDGFVEIFLIFFYYQL